MGYNKPQSPYRIVHVDDNPADLYMVRAALGALSFPYSLISLETAARASQLVADPNATRPDLVLLDINLPETDGIEVLNRIRTIHTPSALPVVIVSTSHHESDIKAAYAQGANGYVFKAPIV